MSRLTQSTPHADSISEAILHEIYAINKLHEENNTEFPPGMTRIREGEDQAAMLQEPSMQERKDSIPHYFRRN